MKRIPRGHVYDLVGIAMATTLSLCSPSPTIAADVDENGVEDADEQNLADKFCPTLVLHKADQDVSPEPVEMVTNQLFRLYRRSTNGEYNGDGFVPWDDFPPNHNYSAIDGWAWGGPTTRPALYCDPQGPSWELYHFDYAGPGAVCELIGGEYNDQPEGWYDAYHNGLTWESDDLTAHYQAGSQFPTTTYAHIFPHPNGTEWVIQYWFFYPFNDWISNHEGDWEHINVVISSNDSATAVVNSVVYFFHEKYKECDPVQTENPNGVFECYIVDGTHPVVFVGGHGDTTGHAGEGSHGSYPVWGKWEHVVLGSAFGVQGVDFDETVGGDGLYIPWFTIVDGDGFDPDGVVVIRNKNQYDYDENPEMSWLKADVAWGHPFVDSYGLHNVLANYFTERRGNEAPRGPAYQETWNNVKWTAQHEYLYLATDFPHASEANWSPPPRMTVTLPGQNAPVTGEVVILGTIHYADEVVLEWGAGASPSTWSDDGMTAAELPVVQSTIGKWNTGVVPPGTYTIRVQSYYGGQLSEALRTVSVTHQRIAVAHAGGNFATIQAGVDFAATGDTVVVSAEGGAYQESITIKEGVHLIATGGPIHVFGDPNEPTVSINDHDYPCYVDGFTFRHNHALPDVPGSPTEHGAKITKASPVFRNCTFKYNVADYGGGVLIVSGLTPETRPVFESCSFSGNRANFDGGGICIQDTGTPPKTGAVGFECHDCDFVGNVAAQNDAGSAVAATYIGQQGVPIVFTDCTFKEHDINATPTYDETVIALTKGSSTSFVDCVFFNNGTTDLVRIDDAGPSFDRCTFAKNYGADGVFGWLGSPNSYPEVQRSIIAFNNGPVAVGGSGLTSSMELQNSIVYLNNDQGRGPPDTAWDAAGQSTYRMDPAFCNANGFNFLLYAFSPASAPAPPYQGYFGERVGAFDVGCVPDAIVDAYSSSPIPNKPDSIVVACPKGDAASVVVSVNLEGSITRNIDRKEVVLDVFDCVAKFFNPDPYVEAASDAVGSQYLTTITHGYIGFCGQNAADVLLNGAPLASKARFEIRTTDTTAPYGSVGLSDFAYFGSHYEPNGHPYASNVDFNDDGHVNLQDYAFFAGHYPVQSGTTHESPHPLINPAPPKEIVQSDAGVALTFTEEFPTATTHRLYVDVSTENFDGVTFSGFAMRKGSDRLAFLEWLPTKTGEGHVMFTPTVQDGVEYLLYGVVVSESFDKTASELGRLVFEVSGMDPMEITDEHFVLTTGDVLLEDAGDGPAEAHMTGVFRRNMELAVARVYHNRLEQNFPNPFNPTTTLAFSLKNGADVNLTIYDVAGRRVRELVNERRESGAYKVVWDGRNDVGEMAASGVYFYKLVAGSFTDTKKMTMLK